MHDTLARWRFRLPHWEVADRPHFITARCAGSLPREVVGKVGEIQAALANVEPASPDFVALQRKYFRIFEHYLDAGEGECPFRHRAVCELTLSSLREFPVRHGWRVPHATLMPNHVHLLLVPGDDAQPLKRVLRGWKWHIAREANRCLDRTGPFWQADWFDRWARHDAEAGRMRDYIRHNPVKARLAPRWEDYPWTHSER